MKKARILSMLLMLIIGSGSLNAQDFLDKITDSCCHCMQYIDTSQSLENIQMQAGLCMFKYAAPYKKEFKKKYNIDLDDASTESKVEFGKLIGMRMVTACPDMIMLLTKGSNNSGSAAKTEEPDNYLVGKITEVQKGQFLTLVIQDVSGRTQKLLWLQYFHNSELLKNMDKLKAAEMKFYYHEVEFYNPQLDDYMKYKVITDLKNE